jgi:hypothetical protein
MVGAGAAAGARLSSSPAPPVSNICRDVPGPVLPPISAECRGRGSSATRKQRKRFVLGLSVYANAMDHPQRNRFAAAIRQKIETDGRDSEGAGEKDCLRS